MMKFYVLTALVLTCITALPRSVSGDGAIPHRINYQGYLTDADGEPLTGQYDFTFRIYDDPTSGELKWSETQSAISVEQGLFHIELGSVDPVLFNFDGAFWLETVVGGEVLTPRQPLSSVGQAFNAADVYDFDIHPRSVSISNYGEVIDSTGRWTGEPDGLTGPQGETGPAGPQGDTGPLGATGIQGETGPSGPPGAQGATGVMGQAGPTGPTGMTGPPGPQGYTGVAGPAGETGPAGQTGPVGPQGPSGPTGPSFQLSLLESQVLYGASDGTITQSSDFTTDGSNVEINGYVKAESNVGCADVTAFPGASFTERLNAAALHAETNGLNLLIPGEVNETINDSFTGTTAHTVIYGKLAWSGFYPTFSGGITAPLKQIFDCSLEDVPALSNTPLLYPQWFGARGDGTADDTLAFQQLFAEGNRHVCIPPGVYMVAARGADNYLTPKENTTVELSQGAVLKAIPHGGNNHRILNIEYDNVTVNGGVFDGNRSAMSDPNATHQHGIVVSGAITRARVLNADIVNCAGDGLAHQDAENGASDTPSGTFLQNLHIYNCGRNGITVSGADGLEMNNIYIEHQNGTVGDCVAGIDLEPNENNYIRHVLMNNVFIRDTDNKGLTMGNNDVQHVSVNNLYVENTAYHAVTVSRNARHIHINDAVVRDCYGCGYRITNDDPLKSLENIHLSNVAVYNAVSSGIYLSDADGPVKNVTVDGFKIINAGNAGLATTVGDVSNLIIRNGYIKDTGNIGCSVNGVNACRVENIEIINAGGRGFQLAAAGGYGNNYSASNIVVRNAAEDAFRFRELVKSSISHCTDYGSTDVSFLIESCEFLVLEHCSSFDSTAGFEIFDNCSNVTLTDCTAVAALQDGIGIYNLNDSDVLSNIIIKNYTAHSCGWRGINVSDITGALNGLSLQQAEILDAGNDGINIQYGTGSITGLKISGCFIRNTGSRGISIAGVFAPAITNCELADIHHRGIQIAPSSSTTGQAKIIGCILRNIDSDAIRLNSCDDSLVAACFISGAGLETDDTCDGISLENSDHCSVVNTKIRYGDGNKSKYGIEIDENCDNAQVIGCNLLQAGISANINNHGANSVIRNTLGWITHSYGQVVVPNGSSSVAFNHHLPFNPGKNAVSLTPQNNLGNASKYWVSTTTNSTVTIQTDVDPGPSTAVFGWSISR